MTCFKIIFLHNFERDVVSISTWSPFVCVRSTTLLDDRSTFVGKYHASK